MEQLKTCSFFVRSPSFLDVSRRPRKCANCRLWLCGSQMVLVHVCPRVPVSVVALVDVWRERRGSGLTLLLSSLLQPSKASPPPGRFATSRRRAAWTGSTRGCRPARTGSRRTGPAPPAPPARTAPTGRRCSATNTIARKKRRKRNDAEKTPFCWGTDLIYF